MDELDTSSAWGIVVKKDTSCEGTFLQPLYRSLTNDGIAMFLVNLNLTIAESSFAKLLINLETTEDSEFPCLRLFATAVLINYELSGELEDLMTRILRNIQVTHDTMFVDIIKSTLHQRRAVCRQKHASVTSRRPRPSEFVPSQRKELTLYGFPSSNDAEYLRRHLNLESLRIKLSGGRQAEQYNNFELATVPVMKAFTNLIELVLPKELLIFWSNNLFTSAGCVPSSDTLSLPSIRSVQFISQLRWSCIAHQYWLQTEAFVPNVVLWKLGLIFPRMKSLLIGPLPYKQGLTVADLNHLQSIRKLVLFYETDRYVNLNTFLFFLMFNKKVRSFLLYTSPSFCGKVLNMMILSPRLRRVCVIMEVEAASKDCLPTDEGMRSLAFSWDEHDWQWVCLVLRLVPQGTVSFVAMSRRKSRRHPRIQRACHVSLTHMCQVFPDLSWEFWPDLAAELCDAHSLTAHSCA